MRYVHVECPAGVENARHLSREMFQLVNAFQKALCPNVLDTITSQGNRDAQIADHVGAGSLQDVEAPVPQWPFIPTTQVDSNRHLVLTAAQAQETRVRNWFHSGSKICEPYSRMMCRSIEQRIRR